MLKDYKKKRDFSKTREPKPSASDQTPGSLRFVVQKHAAQRLHYDFRLELDGVLKSWAVPNGPSLDPQEKRLAVMVEDHPIDYSSFEGVIAHGNYGAGQVIVWDAGTYSPDEEGRFSFGDRAEAEERLHKGLEKGKLSFTLRGHKLKGSWTLVRTSRSDKDWLLIKHRDKLADPDSDVLEDDRSVQSELTLSDLKSGRLPDPAKADGLSTLHEVGNEESFPSKLSPMLARILDKPFSHDDWLFEPKLDGYRVLAFLQGGTVTLLSRNGIDLTSVFPTVVKELGVQPADEMVLDGEVVALDDNGLPNFGLLQQYTGLDKSIVDRPVTSVAITYYPFDLLHLDGTGLQKMPLHQRKKTLNQILIPGDSVQPVEYVEADGESFFRAAVQLGLEGMVAKRRNSLYEPGKRSRLWLKVKAVQAQEFVVGGHTRGTGERLETFGALLVGYYEGAELRYAGKVGTGFNQSTLKEILGLLSGLKSDQCPFAPDPELDKAENSWVRPERVAQVKFAQWTADGRLRAPVFLGLRNDVDPKKVGREQQEADIGSQETVIETSSDSLDNDVAGVLEQLSGNQEKLLAEITGHRISLTNLNKVLWPAAGSTPPVTKRDLIQYYARTASVLLPHLKDRPMTLTRYPDGIQGQSFYQKHYEQNLPEFVETVRLFSSHNEGDGDYILVNNLPTLIWLAQLANIELHPWLSRTVQEPDATHLNTTFTGSKETIDKSALNNPDFIVFDLDPYIYSGKEKEGDEPELNRKAFAKVAEVARALKDILDELSLSSFLKTSGKTGLHIYVPILRQYDYTVTRKTCELIGRFLMQQRPKDVTMEWSVSKRGGKIFLDHNQNVRSKNMASIYSLRPLAGVPVSTPISWDELDGMYPTSLNIHSVPDRIEKMGDLWADILGAKHDLSRLLEA